jgi:hypothetical protein
MISFKNYLLESISGNYISIDSSPVIIPDLGKLFPEIKVCTPDKQHVTLMYSVDSDVLKSRIEKYLSQYDRLVAFPKDVESFDGSDGTTCTVVVTLDCDDLFKINIALSKMGMTHSFPSYSPHLSIAYDVPKDQSDAVTEYVKPYVKEIGSIQLNKFNIEPLDTN